VMNEGFTGKNSEGRGRDIILRHYTGIRLRGLRKITKTISQDSRSPDRDLKPGPPVLMVATLLTSQCSNSPEQQTAVPCRHLWFLK
jgi:hypothetical protein